jgi:SAM-dependent methyltransferase
MKESRYFAAQSDFASERERLSLLESVADPATFERLGRLGIASGWQCLDVGAGGGSVTRWLAERVGPAGHVTAVDLDTRFLDALDLAKHVEVRRHDILAGTVDAGRYDLVHSRALIEHLADPRRGLQNMSAALRPGGWLIVSAADFASLRAALPEHPSSDGFDRTLRAFVEFARSQKIMDLALGPRVPVLFDEVGLVEVGNEALTRVYAGGGPQALLLRQSVDRVRERFGAAGGSGERDVATFLAALDDPSFRFVYWTRFYVWGRRPEEHKDAEKRP